MNYPIGLKKLEYRINQGRYRERVLLAIVGLIAIFFFWDSVFFNSVSLSRKKVNSQMQVAETQIKTLSQTLQELSQDIQQSPTRGLWAQKTQLESQIAVLDSEIAKLMADLISPSEMVSFLQTILENAIDLQIIKIQNMPAKPFLTAQDAVVRKSAATKEKRIKNQKTNEKDDSQKTTPSKGKSVSAGEANKKETETEEADNMAIIKKQNDTPQLYTHRLELTFSGRFFSVIDYLKVIEKIKKRIIWDSMSYQVTKYPVAEVTLTVITISDKAEWVEI